MLPPINLLNTDLVEPATESPMDTRFYRDSARFQLSLGEALDGPAGDNLIQLPITAGQVLPPDGNILPADSLIPGAPRDIAERIRYMVTSEGERTGNIVLPASETIEPVVSAGDPALSGAEDMALTDMTDESAAVNVSPTRQEIREHILTLTGSSPVDAQLRDQVQRRVPVGMTSLPGNSAGNAAADQQATRQNDASSRADIATQLSPLGLADGESQVANAATTNFRLFAEKFDGVQKRIGAVAQASLSITDSTAPPQGPGPATRVTAPPLLQTAINIPVLDSGWAEAFNERVTWMAGTSIQKAEIRLNPADLGPIRVEVSVVDDVATVTFNAHHAVTRDAIELAMPRLREMLHENGISLANTDVSDADVRNGEQGGSNESLNVSEGIADANGEPDDGELSMPVSVVSGLPSALVDTFV